MADFGNFSDRKAIWRARWDTKNPQNYNALNIVKSQRLYDKRGDRDNKKSRPIPEHGFFVCEDELISKIMIEIKSAANMCLLFDILLER